VYAVPGVKAHSDGNEMTSPTTPQVNAIHSIWPQDPGFERALQGGVTALHIMPGSANVIGGRTISLQMHSGVSARAMAFPGAPVGLKMACGENPKRVYGGKGRLPSTRMGTMSVFRSIFLKAQRAKTEYDNYAIAYNTWVDQGENAAKRPKAPKRDLAMETLVGVLRGQVLVHIHCYRADEMVQLLELAQANAFNVRTFHHAVEAYKIREVLGRMGTAVATWADWWGFKIEAHDAIPQNAALVDGAPGGRAIIHSDSGEDIQRLNQEAGKAYWAAKHKGMALSEEDALKWITINPAWAMGVDQLTGSLEKGKRADVVVWSAHPLSVYAQADIVWVEGVREFDRVRDRARAPRSDFELEQLPKEEVSQ
jgi:imidazolonepropionase-like amidohydrolase